MARVLFDHVTKRFDSVVALRELTLEVDDGEFLVLVGPSGSGKSTALRMLAGLDDISDGSIYIGERRVNDVAAKERDIAMVFQTYALYPHMSVRDNMAFGLKLRGLSRSAIDARVQDAAAVLGIEELLGRKPRQLSGGQRQRVALGRAIVREPAVFLLDEPLSNLDAKLRVQTRTEISRLHQRLGTTFVYVTHDQVEAMTMATRIAVLNHGVLQQVGPPQELYERPTNMFVAGFIGSPEMNFFDATVRQEDGVVQLDLGGGDALPVLPVDAPALSAWDGKRLVVGIRPEHIHDYEHVPPLVSAAPLRANVEVVELMGNESFLHLERAGTPFLARVDPHSRARAGAAHQVVLDVSRIYAFDPETEAAIPVGAERAATAG
ncbi:MAG: sn-glycerol-3-phosphate ABC transporter ATP-binding protein UgpC [Dehalococcoidia bacterium]